MCDISLDASEVWVEIEHTCRKAARCSCCRRQIQKGEKYLRHFSIFEGDLYNGRMCTECQADRGEFAYHHDAMLCTPDYFPILLQECIADGDEESERQWKPILDRILSSQATGSNQPRRVQGERVG